MGRSTWDGASASAYASFTTRTAGLRTEEIYSSRTLDPYLDPLGVKLRESRDSAENPESTPIIVALDVTGSMGMIADVIARSGLGTLFESVFDRKIVPGPHVMFMGVGDANCDRAPLQVSQFEADKSIIPQLTKLWLEHGGGGNSFESYNLPWYFAAFHTAHDAFEKRGRRGYLFTVGDEQAPEPLTREQIKRFVGDDVQQAAFESADLLAMAQRTYDCYHVVIEEGNHARAYPRAVRESWEPLMGQRLISLADHKKLAETIVSAIDVAEGRDAREAASAWGAGAAIVHDAIKALPRGNPPRMLPGRGAAA